MSSHEPWKSPRRCSSGDHAIASRSLALVEKEAVILIVGRVHIVGRSQGRVSLKLKLTHYRKRRRPQPLVHASGRVRVRSEGLELVRKRWATKGRLLHEAVAVLAGRRPIRDCGIPLRGGPGALRTS